MDVLYQRGSATVAEVLDGLPDPPSYSAVRATLRVLEDKGQVRHEQDGPRYVYLPAVPPEKARRAAVRHMLRTFFSGSVEQAVAALLQVSDAELSAADLARLAARIEQARKEGR
jgi:BlaI family transcriptional regulator, penicillinase repressor